jgi:hypothetical protein
VARGSYIRGGVSSALSGRLQFWQSGSPSLDDRSSGYGIGVGKLAKHLRLQVRPDLIEPTQCVQDDCQIA